MGAISEMTGLPMSKWRQSKTCYLHISLPWKN